MKGPPGQPWTKSCFSQSVVRDVLPKIPIWSIRNVYIVTCKFSISNQEFNVKKCNNFNIDLITYQWILKLSLAGWVDYKSKGAEPKEVLSVRADFINTSLAPPLLLALTTFLGPFSYSALFFSYDFLLVLNRWLKSFFTPEKMRCYLYSEILFSQIRFDGVDLTCVIGNLYDNCKLDIFDPSPPCRLTAMLDNCRGKGF